MPDLWKETALRLERGETLALVAIATDDGSTPRGAGAAMLVGPDGLLDGTVGGGAAEAAGIAAARDVLAGRGPRLLAIDMSGTLMAGADLICGGRVSLFAHRLEPENLPLFWTIGERMDKGEDCYLVAPVDGSGGLSLLLSDGSVAGRGLAPDLAADLLDDPPEAAGLLSCGGREYFVHSIRSKIRLILAGGGHVSRATAMMAAMADFDVWVVDDRPEFVEPSRFPLVESRKLVTAPGFADCLGPGRVGGPVDKRCYVAILTRGHTFDYEVLVEALGTGAGYIGMIGSRRKRAQMYDKLLEDGFAWTDIERIHSPIGLAIGAETPAEIAVSIVAELVSTRNAGPN